MRLSDSITMILGDHATGKTTILEILRHLLAGGVHDENESQDLVARFEEGDSSKKEASANMSSQCGEKTVEFRSVITIQRAVEGIKLPIQSLFNDGIHEFPFVSDWLALAHEENKTNLMHIYFCPSKNILWPFAEDAWMATCISSCNIYKITSKQDSLSKYKSSTIEKELASMILQLALNLMNGEKFPIMTLDDPTMGLSSKASFQTVSGLLKKLV
ncbi:hypothetical protein DFH28DRAFT_926391 [Melampsora americana]|nr:hypothetical protein DFH28DRAFT_926391 [Melampsora americana]